MSEGILCRLYPVFLITRSMQAELYKDCKQSLLSQAMSGIRYELYATFQSKMYSVCNISIKQNSTHGKVTTNYEFMKLGWIMN
jgi:hypothetical protein